VRLICPQLVDQVIAADVTTLIGGRHRSCEGTCSTTCTPSRSALHDMPDPGRYQEAVPSPAPATAKTAPPTNPTSPGRYGRRLGRCTVCRRRSSATAGTIFAGTRAGR
jgi:hypothetical protein